MNNESIEAGNTRIKELNDKATQVLLFLSFAMVAAATLRPALTDTHQKLAVTWAMRWWTMAIFPALACVLPVKDFERTVRWYTSVRRLKMGLLYIAVVCFGVGAVWFYKAL